MNGVWNAIGEDVCIINVYAPCSSEEKTLLWDRLALVLEQRQIYVLVLWGDFNSIVDEGERVGVGGNYAVRDRKAFREFLERYKLIDVKLQGNRFTWYISTCKSMIERALINEK